MNRLHCRLAALILLSIARTEAGTAQASQRVQQILMVYPESAHLPAVLVADSAFRARVNRDDPHRYEVYAEYLDLARIPEAMQARQVDWIRQKYADRHIDLVVAAAEGTLGVAQAASIFPDVPMVLFAVDRAAMDLGTIPARAFTLFEVPDIAGTAELARALIPRLHRILVVGGASAYDRAIMDEARTQLAGMPGSVTVSYLEGLPLTSLRDTVQTLDGRTAILSLSMFRDSAGNSYIPRNVGADLAALGRAPVLSIFSSYLGHGIIGGVLMDYSWQGRAAADLALRILNGARIGDGERLSVAPNHRAVDMAELRRWGISRTRIPDDTDILNDQRTPWEQYRWLIISVLGVCLIQAALIAMLLTQRRRRSEAEKALAARQADYRALANRLIRAQEEERQRVARELHDDVTQRLAALGLEAEQAGRSGPESAASLALRSLGRQASELSADAARLSHQLHPPVLQHVGLTPALASLCRSFNSPSFSAALTAHGSTEELSAEQALTLYRVAQEGLRNAARHSGAAQAEVTLDVSRRAVVLEVADHGSGFSLDRSRPGGLGLLSMRERVESLGGELGIDTAPGQGTRIRVLIPLVAGLSVASA